MKLNNKGWGLTDYLLIVSAIIIALLFASILIIRLTNGLKENMREVEKIEENKTEENLNSDSINIEDNLSTKETETTNAIDYSTIEDKIVSAGIKYIEEAYKNNISDNLIIVDYPHLLEVDSSLKKEMSKDNCNGYVEAKKNGENIEFTPYIKCDNYSTEGIKDYYITQ